MEDHKKILFDKLNEIVNFLTDHEHEISTRVATKLIEYNTFLDHYIHNNGHLKALRVNIQDRQCDPVKLSAIKSRVDDAIKGIGEGTVTYR